MTLDLDFSDIRRYAPEHFHGIVVIRLERQETPHVLASLERVMPLFQTEALKGHLWIVEEQAVRIRGAVGHAVKLKIS